MGTLLDLTNEMSRFSDQVRSASNQAAKLLRATGSLVKIQRLPEGPGQLSLVQPEPFVPTIGMGRGTPLLGGFQPGVRFGPNFLNYATTFLGFGASGFESLSGRIGGGPFG